MTTPKKNVKSESDDVKRTLLTDLRPQEGAKRPKLRVGRGRASGAGKTCNRGHNGEGQRSGLSRKRGFEGGQMPLYRRLPHIDGFELINPKKWMELNVRDLDRMLPEGESSLTLEKMQALGLFNPRTMDGVRLLGAGDVKRKLTVEVHYATPSAREKVEAQGGQIQLVTQPQ